MSDHLIWSTEVTLKVDTTKGMRTETLKRQSDESLTDFVARIRQRIAELSGHPL